MSNEKEILMAFGKRVLQLREKKELSQMDLAYEIGTSTSHLSKIENGHTGPGLLTLMRLARALEVKPGDLLNDL